VLRETTRRAAHWWELAAVQGSQKAQLNIGGLFFNGDGVPQDYDLAAYWFAKAKLGDDSYARAEATEWIEKSKLVAQRLQSRPLDPNANEATKKGAKLKSKTRINTNEAAFYKIRGDGYNDLGQFKQAIEDYDEGHPYQSIPPQSPPQ